MNNSAAIRLELRADVLGTPPDWCATKWIFERPPFLFNELEPANLWTWKSQLAGGLSVDPKNVLVTGSAAVGVSLNPAKALKAFDQESDVDVAVISTHHFDLAWRALRGLGTQRFKLTRAQQIALEEHVRRYIYWGTIATDRLLPILPFGEEWLGALANIETVPPTEGRTASARIYRDFSSLRAYLVLSFRSLRDKIVEDVVNEPAPSTEGAT